MGWVTYIARRSLAPSHFVETSYTFALSITDVRRPTAGALKRMPESLSGVVETLYFGRGRTWIVQLAPVQIHLAQIHYEFLESTDDGQVFTFDPYGTEDFPRWAMNVKRADDGYSEDIFQREGRGGLTDWVSLGFTVRET